MAAKLLCKKFFHIEHYLRAVTDKNKSINFFKHFYSLYQTTNPIVDKLN